MSSSFKGVHEYPYGTDPGGRNRRRSGARSPTGSELCHGSWSFSFISFLTLSASAIVPYGPATWHLPLKTCHIGPGHVPFQPSTLDRERAFYSIVLAGHQESARLVRDNHLRPGRFGYPPTVFVRCHSDGLACVGGERLGLRPGLRYASRPNQIVCESPPQNSPRRCAQLNERAMVPSDIDEIGKPEQRHLFFGLPPLAHKRFIIGIELIRIESAAGDIHRSLHRCKG